MNQKIFFVTSDLFENFFRVEGMKQRNIGVGKCIWAIKFLYKYESRLKKTSTFKLKLGRHVSHKLHMFNNNQVHMLFENLFFKQFFKNLFCKERQKLASYGYCFYFVKHYF